MALRRVVALGVRTIERATGWSDDVRGSRLQRHLAGARTPTFTAVTAVTAVTACLVLVSCSAGSAKGAPSSQLASVGSTPASTAPVQTPTAAPTPPGSPTVTPQATQRATQPATADAVIRPVPASEWAAIVATGSWHPGCPATQATLRRVEVGFHGFDGQTHRGVVVVNADVATEVARIFTELFDRGFPIRQMRPIEDYGGDDNASMAADNTSAYNCRRSSQANAPAAASPHANGRAIDLDPYENPWIDDRCHCFQPDAYYGSHRSGRGVINKGGVAWTVFTSAGWIWQDTSSVDFQHFDTGYPSRPVTSS